MNISTVWSEWDDVAVLTRVGPGTPMGTLMRRFWMPALLSSELPEPDCAPKRLRLLGENLVAFRNTSGDTGIIAAQCPHRGASLFFGRNEGNGLRCVYHGWKFDVMGKCVDRPSEPEDVGLSKPLFTTAYPTLERGGVVWIYMGPKSSTAAPPEFEWSRLPPVRRTAIKRLQRCNWAQAVEGGIDSSHVSHLHSQADGNANPHLFADGHPVFTVSEKPYGLLIKARRQAGADSYYWRITQFLLPFYSMIPPVGTFENSADIPYDGHAWVPIDDETTWTWSFAASPSKDFTYEEMQFRGGPNGMWGPVDAEYRPLLNVDNDYMIDRKLQREQNYTGIRGIPNQDAAVQESMGPIADRSIEHLGHSDRAIILFRRMLVKLARAVMQGEEPKAAQDGQLYNIRSASTTLPREASVETSAAKLLAGLALT